MPKVKVDYLSPEEEEMEEAQDFYDRIPEWDALDRDSGDPSDLESVENVAYYPSSAPIAHTLKLSEIFTP